MTNKTNARAFEQIAHSYGNRPLQKVVNGFLKNLAFQPFPGRRQNDSSTKAIFLLLLFAGLCQGATFWSVQSLSAFGAPVPSGDTAFRAVEALSEGQITQYLNTQLQLLPKQLPRLRRKHRAAHAYLVLDFHRDPSYSKKAPRGTTKGPVKNSTSLAWSYLTAELLEGGEKRVVAIVLRHKGESTADHVARLFQHLPRGLRFRAVIFDGEFATADTLRFLKDRNLLFLGRCPARGFLKGIMRKAANTPEAKSRRFWIRATLQNRKHEEVWVDATWEWTPAGPRLLIKSPDWHLTISDAEELYRRRFNIESSFRDIHLFLPRTNSSNISVRLMLTFIGLVWYNVYEAATSSSDKATTRREEWETQVRTFRMHAIMEMHAITLAMA